MSTYPEHDKLKALGDRRSEVQGFLDWLLDDNDGLMFARYGGRTGEILLPVYEQREVMMARYFDIDLTVLDDEKRAMLDRQRDLNEQVVTA